MRVLEIGYVGGVEAYGGELFLYFLSLARRIGIVCGVFVEAAF